MLIPRLRSEKVAHEGQQARRQLIWVSGVSVSGVSPAAGQKSAQFDRKRNYEKENIE